MAGSLKAGNWVPDAQDVRLAAQIYDRAYQLPERLRNVYELTNAIYDALSALSALTASGKDDGELGQSLDAFLSAAVVFRPIYADSIGGGQRNVIEAWPNLEERLAQIELLGRRLGDILAVLARGTIG